MNTLDERYGDLLPDAHDADARRAVGDLEAVYTHNMSPPPHLGTAMDRALRAHVAGVERPLPLVYHAPVRTWTRRPIAAAAALVAALAIVGGVYAAVATLGDQALLGNGGTRQIVASDLGRSLDLSRRACGFTVTLNRVYADAQRIVIAYTVVGPAGRTFGIGTPVGMGDVEPTLTTAGGDQFESGGVDVAGIAPDVVMGHAKGQILSYGARTVLVHGVPRPYHAGLGPLALQLTIPAIQLNEYGHGPWPTTPACEAHGNTTPDRATGTRYRGVEVTGPFTYAITAPVAPTRTITAHEVERSGAATITLTGVEVTPSNVRVSLRASGGAASGGLERYAGFPGVLTLSDGSTGGCPTLNTVVDGGRPACRGLLGPTEHMLDPHLASNPYTLDIPIAAYGDRGTATLVIYTRLIKLHDERTPTSHGYTESFTPRYVDPITFHLALATPDGATATPPMTAAVTSTVGAQPTTAPTAPTASTPAVTATARPTTAPTGTPTPPSTSTATPTATKTTMPTTTATATPVNTATAMTTTTATPTSTPIAQP